MLKTPVELGKDQLITLLDERTRHVLSEGWLDLIRRGARERSVIGFGLRCHRVGPISITLQTRPGINQ